MRIFLNHLFFEALRLVKLIQYVADSSILASIHSKKSFSY